MERLSPASQLAQQRLTTSATTTLFTALAQTEITRIVICNTDSALHTWRFCHDDDGVVFDDTTALYYDQTISALTTISIVSEIPGGGITLRRGGSIGVKNDTANRITITLYGITQAAR